MSADVTHRGPPPDVDEGDPRGLAALLVRELRPTPGRLGDSLRIVVVVLIVVVIAEIYRLPEAATSAYIVLFLSRREAVSTVMTAFITGIAVGVAQRAGLGEEDLMKIGLAVRESMVNAVMHGNRYNTEKKVRFVAASSTEQFTVVIADEGDGFTFEALPDPLAPENLMRTSGRGIFLIRSFMDDFQMRHLETGGTEVTLVKNLVSK